MTDAYGCVCCHFEQVHQTMTPEKNTLSQADCCAHTAITCTIRNPSIGIIDISDSGIIPRRGKSISISACTLHNTNQQLACTTEFIKLPPREIAWSVEQAHERGLHARSRWTNRDDFNLFCLGFDIISQVSSELQMRAGRKLNSRSSQ